MDILMSTEEAQLEEFVKQVDDILVVYGYLSNITGPEGSDSMITEYNKIIYLGHMEGEKIKQNRLQLFWDKVAHRLNKMESKSGTSGYVLLSVRTMIT